MSEYDFVSSRTPIAVREWNISTRTVSVVAPLHRRTQVRMCRRLRNWKPQRRWNGRGDRT